MMDDAEFGIINLYRQGNSSLTKDIINNILQQIRMHPIKKQIRTQDIKNGRGRVTLPDSLFTNKLLPRNSIEQNRQGSKI
jgi:hypothetical protein